MSTESRALISNIGSSLSTVIVDNDNDTDTKSSWSIPLKTDEVSSIRNEMYLPAISKETTDLVFARQTIISKATELISGMESIYIQNSNSVTKAFTRIIPSDDLKVRVCFKQTNNYMPIVNTVTTFGMRPWNDVMLDKKPGISRLHMIMILMKGHNGDIFAVIVDAWSLGGTTIRDILKNITIKSSGDKRRIIAANLSAGPVEIKFSDDDSIMLSLNDAEGLISSSSSSANQVEGENNEPGAAR
jgi:hypothetical protein